MNTANIGYYQPKADWRNIIVVQCKMHLSLSHGQDPIKSSNIKVIQDQDNPRSGSSKVKVIQGQCQPRWRFKVRVVQCQGHPRPRSSKIEVIQGQGHPSKVKDIQGLSHPRSSKVKIIQGQGRPKWSSFQGHVRSRLSNIKVTKVRPW